MRIPLIENVVCGDKQSFVCESYYQVQNSYERQTAMLAKKPILIRTSGDSMTPKFRSGDLLLFDLNVDLKELNNGTIIAATLNDLALIKVFHTHVNTVTLFSYNQSYKPISLSDFDCFQIFAKFVDIFKRFGE